MGMAEYRDVFSKRRTDRTEFCNEIAVADMTTGTSGERKVVARFDVYGPYNTAT